jgi:hypothetical protein
MQKEHILSVIAKPTTSHFIFGSDELRQWHLERKLADGTYICHSDAYVVTHRSLTGGANHRVLSFLDYGSVVPRSYDIPNTENNGPM